MLDRMAPPRTLLCSPTEVLSITDLASCTYRPSLCAALRGVFSQAIPASGRSMLAVLHPRGVDERAAKAIASFLAQLGIQASVVPDPDPPMLVRSSSDGIADRP